jgi:hypothetical protein
MLKWPVRQMADRAFFVCAMHGDKLDGASPLWGYVIANH